MQKKRVNKEVLFVLMSAAVCLGFMAFVTVVFPALRINGEEVSGVHAVFGGEYKFNFIVLLGYLLPLIGAILGVIFFDTKSGIPHYVLSGLCLIGVIIILLEPVLFASINEIEQTIKVSLHAGPIIGGLLTILSGIFHISCGYMKRK